MAVFTCHGHDALIQAAAKDISLLHLVSSIATNCDLFKRIGMHSVLPKPHPLLHCKGSGWGCSSAVVVTLCFTPAAKMIHTATLATEHATFKQKKACWLGIQYMGLKLSNSPSRQSECRLLFRTEPSLRSTNSSVVPV